MVNTEIRLIVFFAAKDGESSIQSAKTRPGADCGSDYEHLTVKFRLKLKKVGKITISFSSVQFSCSVMFNYLQPHRLQHTRLPCPSPTPGTCSNSSIESVMPSSHLILCFPLLLLPPIPPSIRVFSNESTLTMRWPKMYNLGFEDAEKPEIKLPTFTESWRKQPFFSCPQSFPYQSLFQ